ncbi:MAG: hypothetical protein NZL89_01490 [Leptospiraceae bacterium]|nr:hypothetical protein [Leptospiraceae bacterium]
MAKAVADQAPKNGPEVDPEKNSFVVLYDSAETSANSHEPPSLDEVNTDNLQSSGFALHPDDAYISEILSSEDLEPTEANIATQFEESTALSNEELDGILRMGPDVEEEFHPDFPPPPPDEPPVPEPPDLTDTVGSSAAPALEVQPLSPAEEDEELPIAISDEDLDEILLEEGSEGFAQAPSPKAPPATARQEVLPDEEEPIALSDDELDHILADAESVPQASPQWQQDIGHEAPFAGDVGGPESEIVPPASHDPKGGFFDSDEDEPITLTDEELDGILDTSTEEAPAESDEMVLTAPPPRPSRIVEDEESITLSGDELDGILADAVEAPEFPATETPQGTVETDFFASDEDEPITLSGEELEGILADAVEAPEPTAESSPGQAQPTLESPSTAADQQIASAEDSGIDATQDFFASDAAEDEPITLSPEELDGILADATPEPTEDSMSPIPAEADNRYADVDAMDTPAGEASASGQEEEPIALSPEELDGIAADAREVTPEAHMVPLSPLDAGSEPPLEEQTQKPETVFEEDIDNATLVPEVESTATKSDTPDTEELRSVMSYLDSLLGELPDDVIEKFAQSEYFKLYQKIMEKLGL